MIFKKRLERGGISKNMVIGFLDESSYHTNINTLRLWSFRKLRIKNNTAKKERVNSFDLCLE